MPATSASSPATVKRWQYQLKLCKFIAHCLIAVAVMLTLPLHKRYMRRLSGWWYRRLLVIMNVRLEVQGARPKATVLAVSNHVSWVDILIYGSLLQPAFVSKAEVAKWPIVGAIARATHTIFLPRGAFKTRQTSDTLAATLKQGTSVMLFPEAATSDSVTPGRFHARLFTAALDHDYAVQPVAIRYLPEHLPEQPGIAGQHPWAAWVNDAGLGGHLNKLLRLQKLNVSVSFCEAISPQGHDRRSLAHASHSSITAQLQP